MQIAGAEGYLVNVDSSSENSRIYSWLEAQVGAASFAETAANDGGGAAYVWLGGDDIDVEGEWVWRQPGKNGYPKLFWMGDQGGMAQGSFTNWGEVGGEQNEPDDYANDQDGLAMALEAWPQSAGFELGSAGQWNDVNTGNRLYYVVEFDAVEDDGASGGTGDGGSGAEPAGGGVAGTPLDGDPVGGCDTDFVTIAKTSISVAPNGVEDTFNIQCALDAAIDGEYSAIKLTAGTFFVGSLVARGFNGTLQGKTKASTVLVAMDNAFACSDAADS